MSSLEISIATLKYFVNSIIVPLVEKDSVKV